MPYSLSEECTARWDKAGWLVIHDLLPAGELEDAQKDIPRLFPTADAFADDEDPERNGPLRTRSDAVLPHFPFESASLNRLVLHDAIIDVAEELLGTSDLRLYQGMVSAKYSDGAPDYEQLLHVDYGNHTLVVPRHDSGYQQVEMFVYLSHVTPETAATRMVDRRFTTDIPVERTYLSYGEYAHLYAVEVPASGPAGSVLVYRPDVYHRGTVLTAPRAARFMLHVAFKVAGRDWLGYQAWPSAAESAAWFRLVQQSSPRQLALLGFPVPGDPYWTETTLAGVAARYPGLDMTPWREVAR